MLAHTLSDDIFLVRTKCTKKIACERDVSKNAIVFEADTKFVNSEAKTDQVLRLADDVIEQYSDAIERLADE